MDKSRISPCEVALGLGSNLGDKIQNLRKATRTLSLSQYWYNKRKSSIFKTPPINCIQGTPEFYNAAVTGTWYGTPEDLLATIRQIENAFGRPHTHASDEARTLDIDILLFAGLTLDTGELTIPHPRMRQRFFVLVPLSEIAPHWHIPHENGNVSKICQKLEEREGNWQDWAERVEAL